MSSTITANQIKTKGVQAITEGIGDGNEAVITVRGVEKFVVMSMNHYNKLREYELEAALMESKRDIETGNYIEESIDEHIKRITNG